MLGMRSGRDQGLRSSRTDAYRVSKTTLHSREVSHNHYSATARVVESLVKESSVKEPSQALKLPSKSASMDLRFVKPGIPITFSMTEGHGHLRQSSTGAFSDLQALMQAEMSVSIKPEEMVVTAGGAYANDRISLSSDVQLPKLDPRPQFANPPLGSPSELIFDQMGQTWRSYKGGPKVTKGPISAEPGSFLKKQSDLHQRKKTWQDSDYLGLNPHHMQNTIETEPKKQLRSNLPQRGVGRECLYREHLARRV